MSIGAAPIGKDSIAAHSTADAKPTRPPRNRQIVARSDIVGDPEAR